MEPSEFKGHASAWFKTLVIHRIIRCAHTPLRLNMRTSEWRVRQALGQRRQLEKESVADYSCSRRTHCTRLNLPRAEWTHYFVQGLGPEIREYVILQKPDNLKSAENFAKLKESTADNSPTFDA